MARQTRDTVRAILGVALAAGLAAPANAQLFTWTAGSSGLWDNAGNWTPSTAFPNSPTHDAALAIGGGYVVTIDQDLVVRDLDIPDTSGVLEIVSSSELTVGGALIVDGTIEINAERVVFDSKLELDVLAGATLSGVGQIRLFVASNTNDAQLNAVNGSVTIPGGLVVRGSGSLNGGFVNEGQIVADDADPVDGPFGSLQINDIVTQVNGVIAAEDADVELNSATITGGRLESRGDNAIVADGTPSQIGAVELAGTLDIPGGNTVVELTDDLQLINGFVLLNDDLRVFNAILRFEADALINGSGQIVMRSAGQENDAQLLTATGVTGRLGPGVVVRGSGLIDGTIINEGAIVGDDPAFALTVRAAIENSAGQLLADGGTIAIRNGATIFGGTLGSSGGGTITATNGDTFLDGVTNTGDLEILGNNASITLANGLMNNGTITLNPDETVFNATLNLAGTQAITGTGEIVLIPAGTDVNDASIVAAPGAIGTIGTGQSVRGAGGIKGDFQIDGTVIGDDPAFPLVVQDGDISISASGQLRAEGDGIVAIRRATITGGTIATSGNGLVAFTGGNPDGNAIESLTNTGNFGIGGSNVTVVSNTGFTNDGTFTVNTDNNVFNAAINLEGGAAIDGTGTIRLVAPSDGSDAEIATNSTGTIGGGQTIVGSGRLNGALTIEGTIAPGEAGVVGDIDGSADLTLGPTTTLAFDVGEFDPGEPADADELSSDTIQLAGTLDVATVGGFVGAVGDSFTIIDADPAGVSGAFDAVSLPAAPAGLIWRVDQRSGEVRAVVTCLADLSSGGLPGSPDFVLTGADFFEFLARFQAGDLSVDFSSASNPGVPDGVLTGADFFEFLNLFTAGC